MSSMSSDGDLDEYVLPVFEWRGRLPEKDNGLIAKSSDSSNPVFKVSSGIPPENLFLWQQWMLTAYQMMKILNYYDTNLQLI